jgi:hypothetical protein
MIGASFLIPDKTILTRTMSDRMSAAINESAANESADVFVYTGTGGAEVPDDVVRVRVDPSVMTIPAHAFHGRTNLA